MTPEPEVQTGCREAALRALRPSLPLSGRMGSHGPTAQLGKSRPGRLHSRQTQSPGHTSKASREKPTTPSLAARQLGKSSRPIYEQLAPLLLCAPRHRGPRPPPSKGMEAGGRPWSQGAAWPRARDPPLRASVPHVSVDGASRPFRPQHCYLQVQLLEARRPGQAGPAWDEAQAHWWGTLGPHPPTPSPAALAPGRPHAARGCSGPGQLVQGRGPLPRP